MSAFPADGCVAPIIINIVRNPDRVLWSFIRSDTCLLLIAFLGQYFQVVRHHNLGTHMYPHVYFRVLCLGAWSSSGIAFLCISANCINIVLQGRPMVFHGAHTRGLNQGREEWRHLTPQTLIASRRNWPACLPHAGLEGMISPGDPEESRSPDVEGQNQLKA